MTPNKPFPQIRAVRTRRDITSALKAKRIDHEQITATILEAQRHSTFTLLLEGNALAPYFENEALLTISPHLLPHAGDAVIAQIGGKYGCMLLNGDGDLWDANDGFVPLGSYEIVGVVVGQTKPSQNQDDDNS